MSERDQFVYAPMEPARWQTEVCGGEVRWSGTKLQQRFVITKYVGGSPLSSEQEWRDVPSVEPSARP